MSIPHICYDSRSNLRYGQHNLVAREYGLSLEICLLIRGWIQDNTEGKNVPIFLLEESLEQIITELKLIREEMLKRGLEKRQCYIDETDRITGNSMQ